MTSSEVIVSLTVWPTGMCRWLISRLPLGCSNFHIHCLPVAQYSTAPGGAWCWTKNSRAPQANIASMMNSGTTDQRTSSQGPACSLLPTSSAWRRRKRTMKTTMRTAISAVKKRLIASQTANMASISRAAAVACSGKKGNDRISGSPQGVLAPVLAPEQQRDHGAQARHAKDRAQADDVEGRGAVPPLHRVVVEAVEEHLVDGRADAVAGRLHQPQPDVARRELDAVQVPRGR